MATDVRARKPAAAGTARKQQVKELHVTSPLMAGPAVLEAQQKLTALGYAPGKLDGQYGPTTAGAVRAFQRDHQLEVDGVVGARTQRAAQDRGRHRRKPGRSCARRAPSARWRSPSR